MISAAPTFLALLTMLSTSPPTTHTQVEQVLGVQLNLTSEGIFDMFEARGIKLGETDVDLVDFREPHSERGATRGPLLAIKVLQPCISRDEIIGRFEGLQISDVPHGHSQNEQTYYSKPTPFGDISFGFPGGSPNCLRTVVVHM